MAKQQEFMKTKPVFSLLLSMGIPILLSMLIQSLYNIIDSIWVTKLGTDALTAVSLAFPLQNTILSVGVGMGIGISAVISLRLGAGDTEGANHTANLGLVLVGIHCLVFLLLGLFLTRPFLQMFTDDPKILEWACDYTYVVMCCSFGQLIQIGLEKIFQAAGKMAITMCLMASGCIVNIILDPVLIFGLWGFPAMGVRGAAIATVIGQVVAMGLYIIVALKGNIGITLHPRYMKFDSKLVKKIYSIGLPSTLMIAMPSLLTGVLNGILAAIDSVYVAVFGLYFKLQTFIYLPANGIIQGLRPIAGYNYSAGEHKRVHLAIRYSIYLVGAIMVLGTLGAEVFPHAILRLFDADADLMNACVPALRIIAIGFIPSAISVVIAGTFEALGKGGSSLTITLLRQLVIVIPLGWLLSRFWGAAGIWISFPIAEAVAVFYSLGRLKIIRQ